MPPTRPRLATPLLALVTLAAAASLGACASGRGGAEREVPLAADPTGACDGQRYVEVRNDTRADVDVYGTVSSTGKPTFLASVRPGVQRVALVEPVIRMHAEQNGRRVTGRGRQNGVTFQVRCERP